MKKLYSIITVFITLLFLPSSARADIEIFQGITNKAKTVTEKATAIIKDIQSQVRSLTEDVNGVYGAYKDVRKDVNDIANEAQKEIDAVNKEITSAKRSYNNARSKTTGAISSAKQGNFKPLTQIDLPTFISPEIVDKHGEIDSIKLQEAVAEAYVVELGQGGSDTELSKEKDDQTQALQRENVSLLYANALNNRVILKTEQEVLEEAAEAAAKAGEDEEARKLLAETNEIIMRIISREARILGYEAQSSEIAATHKSLGARVINDVSAQ